MEIQTVLLCFSEESYEEIKHCVSSPEDPVTSVLGNPRSLELIMLPCMGLSLKPQQKHFPGAGEMAWCLGVLTLQA